MTRPSEAHHISIVGIQWGDEGKGKIVDFLTADCDVVVEGVWETQAQHHAYLETNGCLADVDAEGRITIYATCQSVHHLQQRVADELGEPMAMVRAVHKKFGGSGMSFMLDVEQRYSRSEALKAAEELEELDYTWFEAPLPDFDIEGYRELKRRVKIPIIANGNWILDCGISAQDDAAALDRDIRRIPGVVDTGFFFGTAERVLVAEAETVRTLRRTGDPERA